MKRALAASALFACAALHPAVARAQAAPDSGCSYSRCALRVDYGFFSTRLVRGGTGERVARLGGFGSGVDVLLEGSDSTAHYARQYKSRRQTADALGVLGAALLVAGLAANEDLKSAPFILVGVTLQLISRPLTTGIRRSLDRSIWWYNRDLPRP